MSRRGRRRKKKLRDRPASVQGLRGASLDSGNPEITRDVLGMFGIMLLFLVGVVGRWLGMALLPLAGLIVALAIALFTVCTLAIR